MKMEIGNVNELLALAGALSKSGLMPDGLSKPEAILAIALKGQELGIPPMAAIAGITVIRGKPVVSPQLMLSLVERSGKLQDWSITEESDQAVAVQFTRKGRSPISKRFSIEDAKRMGLAEKDNWRKQPRTMMQWRAIAAAIRLAFPDVIDGCYLPEELNVDVEVGDDSALSITHSTIEEYADKTPAIAAPKQPSVPAFEPKPASTGKMSEGTKKVLLVLAEKSGYATKSGSKGMSLKDFIERVSDRKISSFADVTEQEGLRCIAELEKFAAAIEEMGGSKVDGTDQQAILE